MLKLFLNVHGNNLQNVNALLTLVAKEKPEAVLVLNNAFLASQLADLGVKYVVLRITTNDDEIQNKINSFSEWWDQVKANYADKRLLVHFCNEPHSNLSKLTALCLEGMALLSQEGHRGVFGNFGVGTPEPNNPDLKAFLIALENSEHFLGVHEYWMYSVAQSTPYEIFRYKNFSSKINILLTEFGCDFIEDIYNQIKQEKYSGFKSYNNDPFVFNELLKALYTYNADPRVKGVCFFCYGNSGGWDAYNTESFSLLLDNLERFSMVDTLTIEPVNGNVNRREQPNTTSPIHGQLTGKTVVNRITSQNDWTEYQFPDGNYWLNNPYVRIVPNATIIIQLVNATTEDVQAFENALKVITDLGNKYEISYTST